MLAFGFAVERLGCRNSESIITLKLAWLPDRADASMLTDSRMKATASNSANDDSY